MDFKKMNGEKLKYLETELNLCLKAIEIPENLLANNFINYSSSDTFCELVNVVAKLKADVQDQIKRFQKPYYEITVVGTNKQSDNSSILNAWLQIDLLPSDRQQILTPLEIRSCDMDKDQRYTTEYFTEAEFDQHIEKAIKNLAMLNVNDESDKQSAFNELDDINELKQKIAKYLTGSSETTRFTSFDEVKSDLVMAITDPIQSRAIKNICIWTAKLKLNTNIILHNLPDFTSYRLDRDQVRDKVLSADVVIYTKQFDSLSTINDAEIEIIKSTDYSNQLMRTKDKMIVALTLPVACTFDGDYYETRLAGHKANWTQLGIDADRVVPICPHAGLAAGPTGYVQLNTQINACIEYSTMTNAIERCNDIKTRLRGFCLVFNDFLVKQYNLDVEQEISDVLGDSEMEKIHNEWWAREWKHIKEDFQLFFQAEVRPRRLLDHYNNVNDFKSVYETSVDKTYLSIPAVRRERQKAIFISCMGDEGIVAPKEANNQIRIELARDALKNVERISIDLTTYMYKNLNKLIDWVKQRLWHLPEIKEELVGYNDDRFVEKLMKRSYDSLIQRLLRPTTDLLLRYPRSKVERIRVMKEYELELNIIDNFVVNGRIKRRGVVNFLADGVLAPFRLECTNGEKCVDVESPQALVFVEQAKTDAHKSLTIKDGSKTNEKKPSSFFRKKDKKDKQSDAVVAASGHMDTFQSTGENVEKTDVEPDMQTVLLVNNGPLLIDTNVDKKATIKNDSHEIQFNKLNFSPDASSLQDVQDEIATDFEEFLSCMKNSVFYGTGVQRLYNQELDMYRKKFIDLEEEKRRWSHLVFKYIRMKSANKIVQIPAPKMEDEIENRKKIAKGTSDLNRLVNELL
jgi:hypothetical protein